MGYCFCQSFRPSTAKKRLVSSDACVGVLIEIISLPPGMLESGEFLLLGMKTKALPTRKPSISILTALLRLCDVY